MKTLIFYFFGLSAFLAFFNQKTLDLPPNVLSIYIHNDIENTCKDGQISEKGFWYDNGKYLDTLTIRSSGLVALYQKNRNKLTDTLLYRPDEIETFDHTYAFMFQENGVTDTLYAERDLRAFRSTNKRKYYIDERGFFYKYFKTL
jgi:hypothetical protein